MMPSAAFWIPAMAGLAALVGCGGFGRVNQGQVIEYQRATGLVTIISDSNYRDPANPRYDVLPPVTVHIPKDPREMGPEPEAGQLLSLDWRGRRLVIFDTAAQALKIIPYTLIEQSDGISPDDARVTKTRPPIVDRAKKTVTLYARRDRKLVVISVADEYFRLPDDTWKAGDEIRYYYKDPARALRLMNVSKTDVNRAGK